MKNLIFLVLPVITIVGMLPISGCENETQPEVQTVGVSDITSSSAKLSAVIVDDGNDAILSSGFYYSTVANMDGMLIVQNNQASAGAFSCEVFNLQPNSTYYYQAFAINGNGTGTGEIMSFSTSDSVPASGNGGSQPTGTSQPTITLKDSHEQSSTTIVFSSNNTTFSESLFLQVLAENGITSISIMQIGYNSDNEINSTTPVYIENDYANSQTYTHTLPIQFSWQEVAHCKRIVYEVRVVDRANNQAQTSYVINITPDCNAYIEGTFEWVRVYGTSTGLDEYGLQWESVLLRSIHAHIKPLEGTKLYILQPNDYTKECLFDINFPLEATQYVSPDFEQSGGTSNDNVYYVVFNDVIATVYNGKTYVINITMGGTNEDSYARIITGNYKQYDYTPQ
ncbi:MAG: fibronectin type III domain-containing protein [Bacteroidales bacterium]|nr:fibronectin type III domain-containing protein [Bacteroidales bacterium]